jgi:GntR family histidine utilization transcriptional repressor
MSSTAPTPPPSPQASGANTPSAPFHRVKDYLKQGLAHGQWLPGQQMPSESALVAQFQVSRMTVGRALRELQNQGLITRLQGVGTFAAHLAPVASSLTIRDLHEEIVERGHSHHAQVVLHQAESCPAGLAEQLGLALGAPVYHSLVVHHENGVPLQCEDRYVNPACAPDYLGVDLAQTTATQYLLQVAPLWEAQYTIEAGLATAQEAKLLHIAPTEPCLVVVRRTINRSTPITLVRLVQPGKRYQIRGQFKP